MVRVCKASVRSRRCGQASFTLELEPPRGLASPAYPGRFMRLISAKTFSSRYFAEGDQPDPRTVHGWVAKGVVPGRIINKVAYVDAEAFENSTGNTLADRILGNTGQSVIQSATNGGGGPRLSAQKTATAGRN